MDSTKSILCIDDSNTTLMLLEHVLTGAGYKVVLASNIDEALNQIRTQSPDLILLDLSMPDISGYDFLKMRVELNIEKIPVIIISAFDSKESISSTKELGAVEFISKPIKINKVLETIASYLK